MLNYSVDQVNVVFSKFSDMQLIDIVARAENWTHEKVYVTAHKESLVEGFPWENFGKSLEPGEGGKLPTPVRLELINAVRIHMNAGTLKEPEEDHKFFSSKMFNWFMWGWFIYFILSLLF